MGLLKTIAEAKKYVRINYANSSSSLPNVDRPEREYILPALGRPLYDDVLAKYGLGSNDADFLALLHFIQGALAPLAYWMELPFINTQITDIGLQKTVSAEKQPVFKHDFFAVRDALADQGMEAMEALLDFLDSNRDKYPAWQENSGYKEYSALLIRSGKSFSRIFTLQHPHRCFLALRPAIRLVEDKYIDSSIGRVFFKSLKTLTAPSEMETTLLELLEKAEVYLTIHHATSLLAVSLTHVGFTVQLSNSDLSSPGRNAADEVQLGKLQQEAERLGQSYLTDALKFLNEKASATVFPEFFNSPLYSNPLTPKQSINSKLKSIFAS